MTRQDEVRETTTRPAESAPARSDSHAGWWVAGIVAIVAIFALVFMFGTNRTSQEDLMAARDAGRTQAMMDNAAASAQQMAQNAQASSEVAAATVADAAQNAGENVSQAADQTAQAAQSAAANVGDAAQDASDRVSDPNAQ